MKSTDREIICTGVEECESTIYIVNSLESRCARHRYLPGVPPVPTRRAIVLIFLSSAGIEKFAPKIRSIVIILSAILTFVFASFTQLAVTYETYNRLSVFKSRFSLDIVQINFAENPALLSLYLSSSFAGSSVAASQRADCRVYRRRCED